MSQIEFVNVPLENLRATIETVVRDVLCQYQNAFEKTESKEEYLTRKDIARLFQIDLSTVNNWVKTGKLKAYKTGSRVYYKRSELPECLQPIRSRQS